MLKQLLIKTCRMDQVAAWLIVSILSFASVNAQAVPAFARQTGQNCVACHAGGQFPELTPYGRMFKLTGYTIGERTLPLSVMGVLTANKVKVNDPAQGTTRTDRRSSTPPACSSPERFPTTSADSRRSPITTTTSQDPDTGAWAGHSGSDNLDIRYADHLIDANRDLVYGFTLHNNPGVQDVFNSAPAWGYGVVPGSTGAGDGLTPMLDGGLAQQVAGIGAYAYWNKTVYAELTGYRTGDGVFSFMTQGNGGQINIKGTNPYVRLALTKEWGPHNVMVGLTHLNVHQYTDQTDPLRTDRPLPRHRHRRPVPVSARSLHGHRDGHPHPRKHRLRYGGMDPDTVNSLRAKTSFTYQAKYGATLSYFDLTNSSGTQQSERGWTPEVFWTPVQYVRLGMQYTMFNKDEGVIDHYRPALDVERQGQQHPVLLCLGRILTAGFNNRCARRYGGAHPT